MAQIGLGETAIAGVLITHEHADHIGAARVLSRRFRERQGGLVPFFMTAGTRGSIPPQCMPEQRVRVTPGQAFRVGAFEVEPFQVPHDTAEPVAYAVTVGSVRVAVITDLGRSTRLVETVVSDVDIAVVEFNHDLAMLLDGSYPWALKQRVRGPHGHLSNEQARDLVRAGCSGRLRHLVLAHLSEENNSPNHALQAAHDALPPGCRAQIHVATQDEATGPFTLDADLPAPTRRPTRVSRPARRDDAERQVSLFA